jgi:hypothetical protein
MITEKFINEFLQLQKIIEERAEEVRERYLKLTSDNDARHSMFKCIEDGNIHYDGEEFWGYGGYEFHTLDLPIHYLWDNSWIYDLEQKNKEKEEKLKQGKENKKREEEEKELAELKRLKEKYKDE